MGCRFDPYVLHFKIRLISVILTEDLRWYVELMLLFCLFQCLMALDLLHVTCRGRIAVNFKYKEMWQEAVVSFKVLFRVNLSGLRLTGVIAKLQPFD
jgi:hypothetical protein